MQFSQPSPGLLQNIGGEWIGTWSLGGVSSALTPTQAGSWIADSLNNPLGWGRAGVQFQQLAPGSPDAAIIFHVVDEITGPNLGTGVIGLCSHYRDGSCAIQLESGQYANPDLVNHEAAHGYFFAEHSPEGSDSIMEPLEELGFVEWPSDLDIAQVQAWLGNPPDPAPPELQRYFFPGGLETYITNRHIAAGALARMTCTVTDPAAAIIRPVYADTHAHMLSGDRQVLCGGLSTDRQGWHNTEWQEAKGSGDLFIAFVVEAEPGVSMDELNIAHAELQLSGSGDNAGRDIPN